MNKEYFAIVIGLSRYSQFVPVADLQGPVNDANSVYTWLADPSKGALPPENIKLITSSSYPPPPEDEPWPGHLERQAFEWVEGFAQANIKAMRGRKVGERLYIYASGHGFSTDRREGCLLTANANAVRVNANIGVTAWLRWWQDAGYFREYVVLLDCCMNRISIAVPSPPPLAPVSTMAPPGPAFVAYAARRPLKAIERKVHDSGTEVVHGIFTWTFLDGLKGAAANAQGFVTGQTMATWLRNALRARFAEADQKNREVSQEPEIVDESPTLVLARPGTGFTFEVSLTFPLDAQGETARLWSSVPPSAEEFEVSATITRRLRPGLYLVEVASKGYRQSLTIVDSTSLLITEKGPAVGDLSAGVMFRLSIDAGSAANQISVFSASFEFIDTRSGRFDENLTAGLYQLRIRAGDEFTDRVIFLDRSISINLSTIVYPPALVVDDVESGIPSIELPRIASAIPFFKAPLSHEYHFEIYRNVSLASSMLPNTGVGGAEIFLMARTFTANDEQWPGNSPWDGVIVVDSKGFTVADLSVDGVRKHDVEDPIARYTLSVDPGIYYLRYRSEGGGESEQALVVAGGWRLEVYLLDTWQGDSTTQRRLSLLMRKLGGEYSDTAQRDERLDTALQSMINERPIMNADLQELFLRKFENPLEAIIGGHLLLLQSLKDSKTDVSILDEVVTNLRKVVGEEHPDVEALSLACLNPSLRRKRPVTAPPMFERSWRLLVKASRLRPELVPRELWQRVYAAMSMPPHLVWSISKETQGEFRTALLAAARRELTPVPLSKASNEIIVKLATKRPRRNTRTSARSRASLTASVSLLARFSENYQLPPSAFDVLLEEGDGD